ncbi:RNA pseudouridine synthase [bacterium]|nr:RNA pseudouridine synthase [bacterium]
MNGIDSWKIQEFGNLTILHENRDIIIIDKPVDSIVHGIKGDPDMLLEQVRNYLELKTGKTQLFLAPSNRLDRNTMGPVVFAKNRATAILLRSLFTQCKINKTYRARVIGNLETQFFVEADIVVGSHNRTKVENLVCITENIPEKRDWFQNRLYNSKTFSATLIKPVQTDRKTSLLEIHPWTGRHHQIRAICQALGYPICGDKKYNRVPGLIRTTKKRRDIFTTQALLCHTLEIPDMNIFVSTKFELSK